MSIYKVYLLECKDGSIYTGITTNVLRRLAQHQTGKGARYTRSKGAVKIIYTEDYPNKSSALKREHKIKKMSHLEKIILSRSA